MSAISGGVRSGVGNQIYSPSHTNAIISGLQAIKGITIATNTLTEMVRGVSLVPRPTFNLPTDFPIVNTLASQQQAIAASHSAITKMHNTIVSAKATPVLSGMNNSLIAQSKAIPSFSTMVNPVVATANAIPSSAYNQFLTVCLMKGTQIGLDTAFTRHIEDMHSYYRRSVAQNREIKAQLAHLQKLVGIINSLQIFDWNRPPWEFFGISREEFERRVAIERKQREEYEYLVASAWSYEQKTAPYIGHPCKLSVNGSSVEVSLEGVPSDAVNAWLYMHQCDESLSAETIHPGVVKYRFSNDRGAITVWNVHYHTRLRIEWHKPDQDRALALLGFFMRDWLDYCREYEIACVPAQASQKAEALVVSSRALNVEKPSEELQAAELFEQTYKLEKRQGIVSNHDEWLRKHNIVCDRSTLYRWVQRLRSRQQ